jgi:hypothetical protein
MGNWWVPYWMKRLWTSSRYCPPFPLEGLSRERGSHWRRQEGTSSLDIPFLTAYSYRDTGFSDFVHRPDSKLVKTQRFGNWICFRPQVREDTYSVGSLRKSYPQSLDQVQQSRCLRSPEEGKRSSLRNVVFLIISNPDDGQSPKTQYLCVLYTIVRTLYYLVAYSYIYAFAKECINSREQH